MKSEIHRALVNYARDHHAAGSFVMSCLNNDLRDAATRADPENLADLANIMRFIVNQLPSACWGSEEKVNRWLKQTGPTPLPDLRPVEQVTPTADTAPEALADRLAVGLVVMAVAQLGSSERGMQALRDLLALLDNGGISLDQPNIAALITLIRSSKLCPGTVLEELREAVGDSGQ